MVTAKQSFESITFRSQTSSNRSLSPRELYLFLSQLKLHQYFPAKYDSFLNVHSLLFQRVILTLFQFFFCLYSFPHIEAIF